MRMKTFLRAWARGVGIFALYFCLSIVIAVLAFVGEILPPIISIPFLIIIGPAVICWAAQWLAPELFGKFHRSWWSKASRKETKTYFSRPKN